MSAMDASTREQIADDAEAILNQPLEDDIVNAEVIQKAPYPTAPISIRMSAPLLKNIDRLAAAEGRTRSNLIQRILWEYIRSHRSTPDPKK